MIADSDCSVISCDPAYCTGRNCIKCEPGNYLSGTSCYPCPHDCTECPGPSTCQECVRGKYGTMCESSCRITCLDCVSDSQCTQCIPGRYGQYCQLNCPLGCIDILCDKDTGKCLEGCRHGYYISGEECRRCPEHCTRCLDSNHCTSCVSGYYGTDCQGVCQSSCQNQLCDKDSGSCIEGCIDGYFFEDNSCVSCPHRCAGCVDRYTCTECKTGYWGNQCDQDCPSNCLRCANGGQCISGRSIHFYTPPHDSSGVLWSHVGRPCVRPCVLPSICLKSVRICVSGR